MIYRNDNNAGRWTPAADEAVSWRDTVKDNKYALLFAAIALAVLALAGVISFILSSGQGVSYDPSDSGSSSSSSSNSSLHQEYIDVLDSATEDGHHTFDSDIDAIQFGHQVCSLLDDYYIESIADQLIFSSDFPDADVDSRAAGIVASTVVICPEHLEEVYDWSNRSVYGD